MINLLLNAKKSLYPEFTFRQYYGYAVFIIKFLLNFKPVSEFLKILNPNYPHVILNKHPNVLGFLVWPYIHKEWGVAKRFKAIQTHYVLLRTLPRYLDVSNGNATQIVDLSTYSPALSLCLDKPVWFYREGEITLNLFKNDLRVMSVAFSFGIYKEQLSVFVGCIQGIHSGISSTESLEIIKQLTKDLEGLRPRSFIITALQIIADSVQAKYILAIAQDNRQHFHPYHKNYLKNIATINYDSLWLELNGIKLDNGFFELPLKLNHRDLQEIASNKRAQYRRRYVMLGDLKLKVMSLAN